MRELIGMGFGVGTATPPTPTPPDDPTASNVQVTVKDSDGVTLHDAIVSATVIGTGELADGGWAEDRYRATQTAVEGVYTMQLRRAVSFLDDTTKYRIAAQHGGSFGTVDFLVPDSETASVIVV